MIIAGSVTKDSGRMTIETTVNFSDGNTILSQINKVRKKEHIENTVKLIVTNIIDQFPFEGTVDAIQGDQYRINLGKFDHKIRRGNEFKYMAADVDGSGKVKGYHEGGMLIVKENDDTSSWTEIVALNEGEEINIGDIKIDFIKKGSGLVIHEVKKSKKIEKAHRYQLLYYLYYLKNLGVEASGMIDYPLLRKKEKISLTPGNESEILEIINGIKEIIALPNPPDAERKKICGKCSYYEFCWC